MMAPRRGSRGVWPTFLNSRRGPENRDSGFTLVELLIVVAVMPLIVGALAVGLISVFSLQTSTSNRLGDTSDSQVVSANFESDVQSAAAITTAPNNTSAECGPSNEIQLLGLEWNPFPSGGGYQTVVSYADVEVGTTYSMIRYYCSSGFSNTPTSYSTVSFNIPQPCTATVTTNCQNPPTITPSASATAASQAWTPTTGVTKVEFALDEPNSTESSGGYLYTLAAVPQASAPVVSAGGSPITPATTTGCGFASPGTGTYASTLCLVDFSALTGNNLIAAEQGCLELAVPLPGGSTFYFCIGITGTQVVPAPLPTWQNAFLGNSCAGSTSCATGTPFYTGIPGDPALYQTGSGTTTITITQMTVENAQGVPATGWEVVSADAESTDAGESISWTSNTPLTIMNNDESYDTASDPVGNACNNASGLTETSNDLTVTCAVPGNVNIGLKTGTAMVWALTPKTMTVTLVGSGLQAMAFGLLLS